MSVYHASEGTWKVSEAPELSFESARAAFGYLEAMAALPDLEVVDVEDVTVRGWTPTHYYHGGTPRHNIYSDLVTAAAAITRAEAAIRQTAPHPRDPACELRRPIYLQMLADIEAIFERIQAELVRVDEAEGQR